MEVDLFTLIAQIINFLILVWLLKHFLYDRIVDYMDKREERIKSEMESAQKKKAVAEEEKEKYLNKQKELEEKQDDIIENAKSDAEQKKQTMLEEARKEVEQTKNEWHKTIQREKDDFLKNLKQRAGKQVYTIAKQTLVDLANAELETHIIQVFLRRLDNLPEEDREAIEQFSGEVDKAIAVKSSFSIGDEQRNQLRNKVNTLSEKSVDLSFKRDDGLISGIELVAGGTKITWSVSSYLESLEKEWIDEIERSQLSELSDQEEGNHVRE